MDISEDDCSSSSSDWSSRPTTFKTDTTTKSAPNLKKNNFILNEISKTMKTSINDDKSSIEDEWISYYKTINNIIDN